MFGVDAFDLAGQFHFLLLSPKAAGPAHDYGVERASGSTNQYVRMQRNHIVHSLT